MDDDHQLILVATYGDLDAAHTDFGELERRLKHGMELRSAALVARDERGQAEVVEAANRHGRSGAMIGAGIGALFGLVFDPLLLALVVGGAGGAVAAAVAEHELRSGLRHEVGEALDNGTAVVLALTYPNGRSDVENTLYRANSVTALRMDRTTVKTLDDTVAAEVAKLRPNADTPDTST
ncbi:MAG: hypothetical protein QG655_3364 [Actinomycetota bacterium]|nr:hypothetical protein [Actinomycetota bacterium]HPY24620.1 DUF1269 domain-containing protein [Mycobacterium sp.]